MEYNGPQGVFIKYDMNLGGVHHFPQGRVKGRTPTAQGGREGGGGHHPPVPLVDPYVYNTFSKCQNQKCKNEKFCSKLPKFS